MLNCSDRRRQRGEMLLEALIGVLITGLIGAGMAHAASNIMNSQRDAKVEHLALDNLRGQLQNTGIGLCATSPTTIALPTNASTPVTVNCSNASTVITMEGVAHTITPPPLVNLSVAATDLSIKGADTGASMQVNSAMSPATIAANAGTHQSNATPPVTPP